MAILSRLLLLAAVAPFAFATQSTSSNKSCSSSDFFFDQADCCVPKGGQKNPPSPPTGTQCPSSGWDWNTSKSCCVPHQPTPSTPTCNNGWSWDSNGLKCNPIPSQTSTPTQPSSTPTGGSDNNCGSSEFFFGQKSCCLPHGGQSSPPSPPTGTQCPPSGWYWHTGKGCCVPDHPPTQQPPPQCNNGWDWDDNNLKCCPHSTPTPSPPKPSSHHRKRVLKTRNTSICPKGKEACPIPGTNGLTSESECLDTEVDLTSCGGCASTGVGQDCTAIPGAWNVGCSRGSCQIYTCAQGYKRSLDGRSCTKL